MKSEKEMVEMLQTARTAVRDEVAEFVQRALQWYRLTLADHEAEKVADAWADRFIVLRALKQRGDHAAFVDPTDARDCLRWLAALDARIYTHGLRPRGRVSMYRKYVDALFTRSSDTVSRLFPLDALTKIVTILNDPDLSSAWRSREASVREYIRQCAEAAGLKSVKDMRRLMRGSRRKKLREPIKVRWGALYQVF